MKTDVNLHISLTAVDDTLSLVTKKFDSTTIYSDPNLIKTKDPLY